MRSPPTGRQWAVAECSFGVRARACGVLYRSGRPHGKRGGGDDVRVREGCEREWRAGYRSRAANLMSDARTRGRRKGLWPVAGLAQEQLYQGRDLAVTTDFRDVPAKAVMKHPGNRDTQALKSR